MVKRLELSKAPETSSQRPLVGAEAGKTALRSTVVTKDLSERPEAFIQGQPLPVEGEWGIVPGADPEIQQTDDGWTVLVPSDQSWRREK